MTIVGEKHFTLLPPISILYLEEQEYLSAKWSYDKSSKEENKFKCTSTGEKNKWISVNPDLKEDLERFPTIGKAQSYHVTIKKEEMLYLPSLWYHQVSQCKGKDPYTLAINYWFDMDYTQNFSLY
jgi:jumonji domain-containing protein 7